MCRLCDNEEEFYDHLWLRCPAFDADRQRLDLGASLDELVRLPERAQALFWIIQRRLGWRTRTKAWNSGLFVHFGKQQSLWCWIKILSSPSKYQLTRNFAAGRNFAFPLRCIEKCKFHLVTIFCLYPCIINFRILLSTLLRKSVRARTSTLNCPH